MAKRTREQKNLTAAQKRKALKVKALREEAEAARVKASELAAELTEELGLDTDIRWMANGVEVLVVLDTRELNQDTANELGKPSTMEWLKQNRKVKLATKVVVDMSKVRELRDLGMDVPVQRAPKLLVQKKEAKSKPQSKREKLKAKANA